MLSPVPSMRVLGSVVLAGLMVVGSVLGREYPIAPLPKERQIASGPFQPNWESLIAQYRCPEWFRDAKLGIWAHWSAQCVPEQGDWYGRSMYIQGHKQYEYHVANYGHPSEVGFMEIDHRWTADKWDPEALMRLYVEAGAQFFVALANHEDNFDCYNSKYHAWNSVNVGPQRDIVGTWAKVARAHGLRFGVSNHSAHAWHWLQPAYGYDAEGPRAGVRYDAWQLKKADGRGKWWDGLDPRELYCRPSIVIPDGFTEKKAAQRWHDTNNLPWTELPPPGDREFVDKWFFRLQDLIDQYRPDFLYLDDTELPLGQAGLDIVAHYYNQSIAWHDGKLEAVLTAKGLSGAHRPAVVQAWERSVGGGIQERPFESDTCIGQWHYQRDIEYKTVGQIVRTFIDVVSKNGTLLLSIPQRGDGSIDDREVAFLQGFSRWIKVNGEGIFGSRPWRVFGEGPTVIPPGREAEKPLPYTQDDVRFTVKNGKLYLFVMAPPTQTLSVKALGRTARTFQAIGEIALVGSDEPVRWQQDDDALRIECPRQLPCEEVISFRLTLR